MKRFLDHFKIPTLLGIGIITFGIIGGVFLVLQEQIFTSKASPDKKAQNVIISNISDDSVSISWQTSSPVTSFLTFGVNSPEEQTILDERDINSPRPYTVHLVNLKNLLPKTAYQYRIVTGKTQSEIGKFTTADPLSSQTGFRPIIGSVLSDGKPLEEGLAYLSIAGAVTQSSLIKTSGNFIIPISQIRKEGLTEGFPLSSDTTAKLTILSPIGEASLLFRLEDYPEGLPKISIGENIDLTQVIPPVEEVLTYDLNNDGKINSNDNSILLQNFGKNPKNKKADLNSDGVVDQKDVSLLSKQINQ